MSLFMLRDVTKITGGRLVSGSAPARAAGRIRRVCTDSREARPGDLFIALRGERFDGHAFVDDALHRGALGALVEDARAPDGRLPACAWMVEVPDTLRAYQALAAYHRNRFVMPIVAVTGSNGKTTTKEMVALVLAQRWPVLKTEGNQNNRIGVPQTLLRLRRRHRAAVVEMGVDHVGQTTRLCEIVRPTVGVITNIGPDHLEFFGSLDGSAQAKGELAELMPPDGALVLNADDAYFARLASRASCKVVSFGLSSRADVRAVDVQPHPRLGTTFRVAVKRRAGRARVTLRVPGTHNLVNALAAAAVGHVLGVSATGIAKGLARFRPAAMRSQILLLHGIRVISDCYNANPASMTAALRLLSELAPEDRRLAVLGEMLELGAQAADLHREVGRCAAKHGVRELIVVGSLGHCIAEGARAGGLAAERIVDTADAVGAAAAVTRLARKGDVVLVKASRGLRLERVIDALRDR